jgi:hypothetical protein
VDITAQGRKDMEGRCGLAMAPREFSGCFLPFESSLFPRDEALVPSDVR